MSAGPPAGGVPERHALPPELLHELRTPLGQIIGYAELLEERAVDAGDARLVPDLRKVSAAGYRMLALMDENLTAQPATVPAAAAPQRVPLAAFIRSDREAILAEWEAFARTCTPASGGMDIVALRDHAGAMLTTIAADLDRPQGARAQAEKSRGRAPASGDAAATAAEEHGADRAESGFTMEQMVAEYRALRASVIRLWAPRQGSLSSRDAEDLTRFNEAVDQALAESVVQYTRDLDESKEMFLAILGHDLRTPIGAVLTTAQFVLATAELTGPHHALLQRIAASADRSVKLVGALLDFTRSRRGGGIPVDRAPVEMGAVVREIVAEMQAAFPRRQLQAVAHGDEHGEWDAARVGQLLSNLVGNALEHGSADSPVRVELRGDADAVVLAVHNRGPAIPPARLHDIFDPMKPRDASQRAAANGPGGNLGLGLYIADRIARAHDGSIHVESSDEAGTTFRVCLPRRG